MSKAKGKGAALLPKLKKLLASRPVLVLGCYLAALLIWVCSCFVLYWNDSAAPHMVLNIADAERVDLQQLDSYRYQSTSGDPQLIYEGLDMPLRRVVLYADFEGNPGEMDLYYTRREGQGFSPKRRAWGYLQEDGSYEYILPTGNVWSLRIDPGTREGEVALVGVELNPRRPLADYFALPLNRVLLLLLAPALAACGICTIMELYTAARPLLKGRAGNG